MFVYIPNFYVVFGHSDTREAIRVVYSLFCVYFLIALVFICASRNTTQVSRQASCTLQVSRLVRIYIYIYIIYIYIYIYIHIYIFCLKTTRRDFKIMPGTSNKRTHLSLLGAARGAHKRESSACMDINSSASLRGPPPQRSRRRPLARSSNSSPWWFW